MKNREREVSCEQEAQKPSLRMRLRRWYRDVTGQFCRLEAQGCRAMVVQGCREILTFSHEEILLSVRDPDVSCLCIRGTELICVSYHPDGLTVEGNVECIEYRKK